MILYFSATGNCKYVAERLAQSAEIISIVDCMNSFIKKAFNIIMCIQIVPVAMSFMNGKV